MGFANVRSESIVESHNHRWNYKIENFNTYVVYCCIIATTTKWDYTLFFLELEKVFDSSSLVYICLHASIDLSIFVYICLYSSSDLFTLVCTRLETRIRSSTFVYTRLVTCLCFENRSSIVASGSNSHSQQWYQRLRNDSISLDVWTSL